LVTVCARIPKRDRVRAAIQSHAQVQTLAYIERVRIGGGELGSKLAKKTQHFFSRGVDELHFRQIHEQLSSRGATRCKRASLFCVITSESAFES
jgi:hypothetical protein